jgi:GDPmannose 4,6-dehydratase
MPVSLITGISGQDGSYLAELLLKYGHEVHGIIRRSSSFNTGRIDHIFDKIDLHYGDLSDGSNLTNLLHIIDPDYIFNMGAQSHVKVSFETPEYTGDITGLGVTRLLEAIRHSGVKAKLLQASSSEMFGAMPPPQNELTPFNPQSPYAAAKVYAYHMIRMYRRAYNIFAVNTICFNHESPRRGETFVTRKITKGIAKILSGKQNKIVLGNLDAKRDWGYAKDYVEAMYKIINYPVPEDFVIGTGETHTVREFLEEAFKYAGCPIRWEGGRGIAYRDKVVVETDTKYYRPTEVDVLLADTIKIKLMTGWEPTVKFKELVKIMVDADLKLEGL